MSPEARDRWLRGMWTAAIVCAVCAAVTLLGVWWIADVAIRILTHLGAKP